MWHYMGTDVAVYWGRWESWDEWEVGIDVALYGDRCVSIWVWI